MACEYLLAGSHPLCLAVQGLMTPSLWEMCTYCTSDHWSESPLYQEQAATRERVPLGSATEMLSARVPRSAERLFASRAPHSRMAALAAKPLATRRSG